MCGIGGVILSDKRKAFSKDMQLNAVTLFCELEDRGTQSWGVFLVKHGKHNHQMYCGSKDETLPGELMKQPGSITDFFDKGNLIYMDHLHTMLMHTRASTRGSAEENENNHPFHTKDLILAHNGTITNHQQLKTKHKIQSDIECDSYYIATTIQAYLNEGITVPEAIKKASKDLTGGYACWLYHKPTGDTYLFRNTNPISYYIDKKNQAFVFASTHTFIVDAYNNEDVGTSDVISVPDEKIYKVKGLELEEVGELDTSFRSTSTYRGGNYRQTSRRPQGTTPSTSDISTVHESLVYLYKLFEKYEKANEIKTVVAIMRDEVLLIVEPPKLVKLLDTAGFNTHKAIRNVYNTQYVKYSIAPKEDVNKLVEKLKDIVDGKPPKDDKTFTVSDEPLDKNPVVDKALKDLCDSVGCIIRRNKYKGHKYIFITFNTAEVDDATRQAFSDVGLTLKENNKLKVEDNKYHREGLIRLLKKSNLLSENFNESTD